MFFVVKRKTLILALTVLICFIVSLTCVGVGDAQVVFFGKSARKVPVYSVETEEKVLFFLKKIGYNRKSKRQA